MDILKEKVHQSLIKAEMDSRDYRKGKAPGFYPSSIGMCTRAIVYGMLGYDRGDPDPKFQLVMMNGTSFHERFENILERAGIQLAAELPIELPDLMIRGRSDSIIKNIYPHDVSDTIIQLKDLKGNLIYEGPDSEVLVSELKSISSNGFDYLVKNNKAKEEHIQQLTIYLHALKIPEGVLIYENKNTQDLYTYRVKMDPKVLDYVVSKIKTVIEFYKNKELPSKEFMRSSFECTHCDFCKYCWEPVKELTLDEILDQIEKGIA